MDLKWNTPVESLTKSEISRIFVLTVQLCQEEFGPPVAGKIPSLKIRPRSLCVCAGQYCWVKNQITVVIKQNPTLRSLIDTIIHEYVHSVQDLDMYFFLEEVFGYRSNPLEVQAVKIAEKWRTPFLRAIKSQEKIILQKNHRIFD
jgi:hypothetical protein